MGYADTGRTITTSGYDSICLWFPKSRAICIPIDPRYWIIFYSFIDINNFSHINITDVGTRNIFFGSSVIGTESGTVLLKATDSNNSIGAVKVLGLIYIWK